MQKYFGFIAPYSLVVSLLYLFGYWGAFDVNILEYIDLSDVVKNALHPLIYSSIFVLTGLVIGKIISLPMSEAMPPGGGAHLPEAKYFRWLFRIIGIIILVSVVYFIFFEIGNSRWFVVAVLLTPPINVMVGEADFASSYFQNKHIRIVVVNALIIVFLYSFGWGAINAYRAKDSEQTIVINGDMTELKYLGWAGDFLFLWDGADDIVVAKSKSIVDSFELSPSKQEPIINLSFKD